MVAPVKIRIDRIQIGLAAKARDFTGNGKDRMGHLTGDHIDLVRIGGCNDHIGIGSTGPVQHIGIAGKARNPLHIQRGRRAADQIGIVVDNGDVVLLARKVTGNLPPHLPCAADDDLHACVPSISEVTGSQIGL